MRINHNVPAMIGQGSLHSQQASLNKSLEKLSTGLRINRASDDAAGLSVSESLRARVRGMGRAKANAEDGVALLQIAVYLLCLMKIREIAQQNVSPAVKQQLDQVLLEEKVLNILVGAVTGFGETMVTKESLKVAAEQMREAMIADSTTFKGVVDSTGKVIEHLFKEKEEAAEAGLPGLADHVRARRVDASVSRHRRVPAARATGGAPGTTAIRTPPAWSSSSPTSASPSSSPGSSPLKTMFGPTSATSSCLPSPAGSQAASQTGSARAFRKGTAVPARRDGGHDQTGTISPSSVFLRR